MTETEGFEIRNDDRKSLWGKRLDRACGKIKSDAGGEANITQVDALRAIVLKAKEFEEIAVIISCCCFRCAWSDGIVEYLCNGKIT